MKTVKVRVAVAVDARGMWNASGWLRDNGEAAGEQAMEIAIELVADDAARYWLTADLPVPEPVEVAAKVEKAG